MKDVPGRHDLMFFYLDANSVLFKDLRKHEGCRFAERARARNTKDRRRACPRALQFIPR